MMAKDFKELVDIYHEKKIEGMDFSQIRKEMAEQGVDEKTIKDVVRVIDNRLFRGEVKPKGKNRSKELRLMGWVLMIIGGLLTIGTYLKWFSMEGYFFLSYAPVIAGYLLIIAARRAQRKMF
jgi:hypothetical protein